MLAFNFIKVYFSSIWECEDFTDILNVLSSILLSFMVIIISLFLLLIDIILSPIELIVIIIYFIYKKKN